MLRMINKILRARLLGVVIILPLVCIVFFQSISSERLILRISKDGELSLIAEQTTKQLKPSVLVDACCSTMAMSPMDCCESVQVFEPVKTSVCCTDIMLGGGIGITTSQNNLDQSIVNSAQYESIAFVPYSYSKNQITKDQYLTHDPPGYVKTTVLRL